MKPTFFFMVLALCAFSQRMLAQSEPLQTQKPTQKGSLFFSIGTDYSTGLEFTQYDNHPRMLSRGVNVHEMTRGGGLFYSLDYYLTSKISIGFSHGFRYDHLHEASQAAIPGGENSQAVVADTYTLQMSYHAYAQYHHPIGQKGGELFLQFGLSSLFHTPDIKRNPTPIHSGENVFTDESSLSLEDITTKWGIGYQKNRFQLFGGVYYSKENPFYDGANYILPYISFSYRLGKLFN